LAKVDWAIVEVLLVETEFVGLLLMAKYQVRARAIINMHAIKTTSISLFFLGLGAGVGT
jgi:hypothetical protein